MPTKDLTLRNFAPGPGIAVGDAVVWDGEKFTTQSSLALIGNFSGTITFYAAETLEGPNSQVHTVTVNNGRITSWTHGLAGALWFDRPVYSSLMVAAGF